jgi:signal transduction histidine kinase
MLAIGIAFSITICAQTQVADSLINVLNTQKLTSIEQLGIYEDICAQLIYRDIEKYATYAEKGLALAEKENDKAIMAAFTMKLGTSFALKKNHDYELIYYEKALVLAQDAQKENLEASIYVNMANTYGGQSNYEKALEYYLKALHISKKNGNKKNCMNISINVATIHQALGNIDRQSDYLEQAKALAEELNDTYILCHIYHTLCAIHSAKGEYDQALEQALWGVEVAHANGYVSLETTFMLDISNEYIIGFQNYAQAEKYANEALALAEKQGDTPDIIQTKLTLATIYLNQKRYHECDVQASTVYEMDTVNTYTAMIALKTIVAANIFLGNNEKAILYFNKYIEYSSKIYDANSQKSLSEMEVKYKTEEKEIRIAEVEKEKRLYVRIVAWMGISFLAFLAFSFVFYRLMVHKRILAEQKMKVSEQQVKLLEQEKQIIAAQSALDGETKERTRLARDLHDGLGGMLSIMKLHLDDAEHLQTVREILDSSIEELRRVAHHLMPASLLRIGLKAALEDFCQLIPNAQFYYFGDDSRLDDRIELLIYRCAYELVNNALKYADASHIFIQLVQDSDRISLKVEDDGCGFDTEKVVWGMGLENLRTRVTAYDGKLNISSSQGKGTVVYIELTCVTQKR